MQHDPTSGMFVFVPMSDPIPSTYPWMDAHVELVLATTATVAARLTKNIVILLVCDICVRGMRNQLIKIYY